VQNKQWIAGQSHEEQGIPLTQFSQSLISTSGVNNSLFLQIRPPKTAFVKILILDDENLDMFLAKKQLERNYEVAGFTTHTDALAWAKQNDFDVALIDYYLGSYLTGPQVLQELIKIKGQSFKAFLLTNYIDNDQVDTLKAQGFHNVIFKPLTYENFAPHLTS